MSIELFEENINESLGNIRVQIAKLTSRYVESTDSADTYTDALAPLLKQELDLLTLLKSKDE